MEGVGSRLGRASSRYGPVAAASVFSGPVRKWKKRWVNVSPPPTTSSNGRRKSIGNGNNNSSSQLLLCRWTPLPSTLAAPHEVAADAGEAPPKRRLRYTPIAVIEEQKKRNWMDMEDEAKAAKPSEISKLEHTRIGKDGVLSVDNDAKNDDEDLELDNLDLGLCLKGHRDGAEKVGRNKEEKKSDSASSSRFWSVT